MRTRLCFFFIGVVLCLGAGLGRAQIERPIFLDKEGKALPIQDDEDLVSFLKTARVTASEDLPVGITKPIRLALSQGDVEARAVFHSIIKSETGIRRMPSGRARGYRRDSYTSQVAAYEIGLMLQIHNIPPTAKRIFDGLDGSVQLWIENAMTEQQRQEQGIKPPNWPLWNQLYADMRVFDNLINNIDRNTGNMLIDSQGHLWLIDHTRSFGQDKTIPHPEAITRCSNRLYAALQNLDEEGVEKIMRNMKLLAPGEIKAIFRRRTELLEKIDDRIRLLGEENVLFDYGDPEPGVEVKMDAG